MFWAQGSNCVHGGRVYALTFNVCRQPTSAERMAMSGALGELAAAHRECATLLLVDKGGGIVGGNRRGSAKFDCNGERHMHKFEFVWVWTKHVNTSKQM